MKSMQSLRDSSPNSFGHQYPPQVVPGSIKFVVILNKIKIFGWKSVCNQTILRNY